MHQQNQIKRTLDLPKSIEVVRPLLNSQAHKNRASLSKTVCQHFNFHDARGRPQIGGCVKALRELERVGFGDRRNLFGDADAIANKSSLPDCCRSFQQPLYGITDAFFSRSVNYR